VVATDVGGTAEISKDSDLILVKPGDEKDLMRGLEKAISDYSLLS
jgi:glycosyltransferase involved in cell wall biosynthesis